MALKAGLVIYSDPLSCAILAICAVYNNRHKHSTHTHPHLFIELTELGLGREAVSVGAYMLNGQHPLSSLPPNTSMRPQGGHETRKWITDSDTETDKKDFNFVRVCASQNESVHGRAK